MVSVLEGLIGRALDAVVTRARADSPRTVELLAALAGQSIEIELTGASIRAVLACDGGTLTLRRASSALAQTRLIGTPLSLLALLGDEPRAVLQRGAVRIEGDTELAEQFQQLLMLLRPDLEHLLAQTVGRGAAHLLMRGAHSATQRVRTSAWSSLRSLADYLAHESSDLVSRPEAEHVLRGVEQLREQLDRLEARLQHLEQRAAHLGGDEESI